MSADVERIAAAVEQLCTGWTERVERTVQVAVEKNGLRYVVDELRVNHIRQLALLVQLNQGSAYLQSKQYSGSSATNKPGSKPPGNNAYMSLIDTLGEQARELHATLYELKTGRAPRWDMRSNTVFVLRSIVVAATALEHDSPRAIREAAYQCERMVKRAREVLGYERPLVLLESTVCGTCGGTLIVASDASTDVRCIGTNDKAACGTIYRREQWLNLL